MSPHPDRRPAQPGRWRRTTRLVGHRRATAPVDPDLAVIRDRALALADERR